MNHYRISTTKALVQSKLSCRIIFLALLISAPVSNGACAQDEIQFEQITAETSYRIGGSIEEVFNLFTPRGRESRLGNWTFEFIHEPENGSLSGTVFRQSHNAADVVQTWILNESEYGKSLRYSTFISVGEILETDMSFTPLEADSVEVIHRVRATATENDINAAVRDYGRQFPDHSKNNGDVYSRILRDRR